MPFRFNSLRIDYKAVFKGGNSRLLIGQVKHVNANDQSLQVKCLKLSLDPKLLKYWNARKHFRADDDGSGSKIGDIVLISQLPVPKGYLITHKVKEILYKNGAVLDPMTGKLCHTTQYTDQVQNPKLEEYLKAKA